MSYDELKRIIRLEDYHNIAGEYIKIISLGIKQRWDKISSYYIEKGLDPVDELDDELEMLRMFKYRMELMIICCLCETWEQDLYNFLKEEKIIENEKNQYTCTKCKFESNYPTLRISKFPKLREMREFVNAVKHGEGRSLDSINKKFKDDVLADSCIGEIKENGSEGFFKQRRFDSNTLTSITLNPDGKIKEYYDEIIRFWQSVFDEMQKNRC